MKKVSGIASILILCLFFACTKPISDDHASKTTEWQEKTLTIDLDECENIVFGTDHLRVCLDSVSDSRCPMNANCIWAGTAIAKFTFTKNGQANQITLAIPPFASYQQEVKVAGYNIKLINVFPYPDASASAPLTETQAKIEIKNY